MSKVWEFWAQGLLEPDHYVHELLVHNEHPDWLTDVIWC